MEINLIRLYKSKDDPNIKIDDGLIEDINEQLLDEDIILKEGVKDSFIDVVLIGSDDVFSQFLKMASKLKPNCYVICFKHGRSFMEGLKINTYINREDLFWVFDDNPLESMKSILPAFIDISKTYNSIQGKTFGVIMETDDPSNIYKIDEGKFNKITESIVIKIGKEELIKEYKKYKIGKPPHLLKLKKMVKNSTALNKSLYLYGALSRLVDKYHLEGFTLNGKAIKEELGVSASLALSLLNEEGIICLDTNNLGALYVAYAGYLLSNSVPYFAVPLNLDYHNHLLEVCLDYPALNQLKSFEVINPSGDLLEIQSTINTGECSILKINQELSYFKGVEGEIKSSNESIVKVSIEEREIFEYIRDGITSPLVLVGKDISVSFSALFSQLLLHK